MIRLRLPSRVRRAAALAVALTLGARPVAAQQSGRAAPSAAERSTVNTLDER